MNKIKPVRFDYADEYYGDESHSICVYKDFLLKESIIDGFRGRTRTTYQFEIEGNELWVKCLEAKAYRDKYSTEDGSTEGYEKDSNGDYVAYRIRNGKPNPKRLSGDRYKELEEWLENGKYEFDFNNKEEREQYELIMDEKKEYEEIMEDFESECDWHSFNGCISAKAFVFKQALSEKESTKLINNEIENINKFNKAMSVLCGKYNLEWQNNDKWDEFEIEGYDKLDKKDKTNFDRGYHKLLKDYGISNSYASRGNQYIKEMKEIIKNGNVKRSDNYGAELTMKSLEQLKEKTGLGKK